MKLTREMLKSRLVDDPPRSIGDWQDIYMWGEELNLPGVVKYAAAAMVALPGLHLSALLSGVPYAQAGRGDWSEVWKYVKGEPARVPPDSAVSTAPFNAWDVEEVLHEAEGENDGCSWVCVVRLHDGRYGVVEASCDYTGWG